MKPHIFISLLLLPALSALSFASDKTDADWQGLLLKTKLPTLDQSYCYTNSRGSLEGVNLDLRVRLASVSKLLTSLWGLDTLGAKFKYKTDLFIKDGVLHLEGSEDPFMGNEKMYFLLSQLNDLGLNHFDKITFDKNFIIFPNAQGHIEEHPTITNESITKNLKMYFNTASWSPSMKVDYARVQSMAGPGRMRKEISFNVPVVAFVNENPLENSQDVRLLTLSSPPLYRYLKEMNVESNNFVAQMLFKQLGGERYFTSYMVENFRFGTKILRFWSGSGLPTMLEGIRYDNYATCQAVMTLIEALKEKAEKAGLNLEDIVAVPGSDQGTFRNRIFPSDYKNTFVAKTGTLMHTSTLAGAMSTQSGLSFYGLFNQSSDIESSKKVQNAMVASLMTELGGPKAFNYKVLRFDAYGEDNVKNLLKFKSDFLPIEENLY